MKVHGFGINLMEFIGQVLGGTIFLFISKFDVCGVLFKNIFLIPLHQYSN